MNEALFVRVVRSVENRIGGETRTWSIGEIEDVLASIGKYWPHCWCTCEIRPFLTTQYVQERRIEDLVTVEEGTDLVELRGIRGLRFVDFEGMLSSTLPSIFVLVIVGVEGSTNLPLPHFCWFFWWIFFGSSVACTMTTWITELRLIQDKKNILLFHRHWWLGWVPYGVFET